MGKEIYFLHENGRKLFTSPMDCTPIQRFIYVLAKDHHEDTPDDHKPGGFDKSKRFNKATNQFG